jgi:uncharacterized protein
MKNFKILLVLVAMSFYTQALQIPNKPTSRVLDLAHLLTTGQQSALEQKLDNIYSSAIGTEVEILTIPSLDGADIGQFSLDTARKWQLGQKKANNGLLIVVAPKESQVRVEVGYGLEGILPDGYIGRLEQDVLVPNFKADNYYVGLNLAVDNLHARILKEYKGKKNPSVKTLIVDYWIYFLLAVVLIVLIATGHWSTALYILMLVLNRGRGGGGNDKGIGGGGGFGGGGANRRW